MSPLSLSIFTMTHTHCFLNYLCVAFALLRSLLPPEQHLHLSTMSPSQFVRRKQSKKRRPRSSFTSPSVEENNGEAHQPWHPPKPTNQQTSSVPLSTATSRSSRSRLRAPPKIPGYDHDSQLVTDPLSEHAAYSVEQLNVLKKNNASNSKPLVQPPSEKSLPIPEDKNAPNGTLLTVKREREPPTELEPLDKSPPVQKKSTVRLSTSSQNNDQRNRTSNDRQLKKVPSTTSILAHNVVKSKQTPAKRPRLPARLPRPDPFSEEWRRSVGVDQPSFLLDSEDEELHPRSLLKLERMKTSLLEVGNDPKGTKTSDEDNNIEMVDNISSMKISTRSRQNSLHFNIDEEEQDQEDSEWQKQLLRRAGVKPAVTQNYSDATAEEAETIQREERLIREEIDFILLQGDNEYVDVDVDKDNERDQGEENGTPTKEGENVLLGLMKQLEEKAADAEQLVSLEKEQFGRMRTAALEAEEKIGSMKTEIGKVNDKQEFYQKLREDVNALSKRLRITKGKMEKLRYNRIERWRKMANTVSDVLRSELDEFGRVRRNGGHDVRAIAIAVERVVDKECTLKEIKNPLQEEVEDCSNLQSSDDDSKALMMSISIQNVKGVVSRFKEWNRRLPREYEESNGDISSGRLIGAVATGEPSIRWVLMIESSTQLKEACTVSDVVEEAYWWVRAQWNPIDPNSTDDIGEALKRLWPCVNGEDEVRLERAVEERLGAELDAAESREDVKWVSKVVTGAVRMSMVNGRALGIGRVLKAVDVIGVSEVAKLVEGDIDTTACTVLMSIDGDMLAVAKKLVTECNMEAP